MNPHVEKFEDAAHRFTTVVQESTDWAAPTPCAGWSAGDLIDHVVDTERDFLAGHGVHLGERPTGAPDDVWASHLAALVPVLGDDDFWEREVDSHFGPTTPGQLLERFYAFDLVVHGWDLGVSQGRPTTFSEVDMDTMEKSFAAFGEAMYAEGVFRPAVEPPAGADRQTRLLARMGRLA
ncbi:TIGR03086 family metal-binding protein [Nocardioides pantholopis]|uniref:TIGR03086 family metal-binding protein n=1 Tax=Nocardioides pantholopis TaxID=2483798 RepID=UPI0013DE60C3|nr:TIGR03086 family metal-binding protein [Nocardioides pantholopis]